jgi:cytochrome c oxidase assembly protein subunit 15
VQSGLVDRVDVSQYRLALHLSIAFAIFALLVWLALDLQSLERPPRLATLTAGQRRMAWLIVALVFLQVALGAFVAGTKAGLVYNTWPLMDGRLLPEGMAHLTPWYLNLTENHGVIQLNHRLVAYLVVALALWHWWSIARSADDEDVTRSAALLGLAVLAQAGLGIWTLLAASGAIPIGLGLAHQGGAAVVLGIAVWHLRATRRGGRVVRAA